MAPLGHVYKPITHNAHPLSSVQQWDVSHSDHHGSRTRDQSDMCACNGLSTEVLHLYLNQANLTTSGNKRALVERMLYNAIIPIQGESGEKLAGQDGTQNEDEPAGQDGTQNEDEPAGQDVHRMRRNENEPAGQDGTQNEDEPAGQDGTQNKDEPAGQDGTQNEDEPAGQDGTQNEDEPAGQDGTQNEDELAGQDGTQNENEPAGQDGTQNEDEPAGQDGTQNEDEPTGQDIHRMRMNQQKHEHKPSDKDPPPRQCNQASGNKACQSMDQGPHSFDCQLEATPQESYSQKVILENQSPA